MSTAVQCSYRIGTAVCVAGARAFLTYQIDPPKRVKIVARSRSGRWVVRWERLDRLHQFRFKSAVMENPVFHPDRPIAVDYWQQETVDQLNELAKGE